MVDGPRVVAYIKSYCICFLYTTLLRYLPAKQISTYAHTRCLGLAGICILTYLPSAYVSKLICS